MKRDKKPNGKLVPVQNCADKYQISPQASSELPGSITNTVTEHDVKVQIGREPVTQTQSKELESHNVERSHCYSKTLISSKNKPSNAINLNRRVNPEIGNVNPHNA